MGRHRKSIRLKNYDYSQSGGYFVTLCSKDRRPCFGKILNEKINLSSVGEIVERCWLEIPKHFLNVQLDEWVIMSNHIHGIIIINPVGADYNLPRTVGTDYNLSKSIGKDYNLSRPRTDYFLSKPIGSENIMTLQKNRFQHITPKSLSYIIATFKSAVKRTLNKLNYGNDFA